MNCEHVYTHARVRHLWRHKLQDTVAYSWRRRSTFTSIIAFTPCNTAVIITIISTPWRRHDAVNSKWEWRLSLTTGSRVACPSFRVGVPLKATPLWTIMRDAKTTNSFKSWGAVMKSCVWRPCHEGDFASYKIGSFIWPGITPAKIAAISLSARQVSTLELEPLACASLQTSKQQIFRTGKPYRKGWSFVRAFNGRHLGVGNYRRRPTGEARW